MEDQLIYQIPRIDRCVPKSDCQEVLQMEDELYEGLTARIIQVNPGVSSMLNNSRGNRIQIVRINS